MSEWQNDLPMILFLMGKKVFQTAGYDLGAVLFLRRDNPDISVTLTIRDKEKRAVLW